MEEPGVSAVGGYDTYVHGLLRFSSRSEQKKSAGKAKAAESGEAESSREVAPALLGFSLAHASPLSPLRSRDIQALVDIFAHDQLSEIEADIHQYLHRLCPEPCWEVEPYDFLKGFI